MSVRSLYTVSLQQHKYRNGQLDTGLGWEALGENVRELIVLWLPLQSLFLLYWLLWAYVGHFFTLTIVKQEVWMAVVVLDWSGRDDLGEENVGKWPSPAVISDHPSLPLWLACCLRVWLCACSRPLSHDGLSLVPEGASHCVDASFPESDIFC